MENRVLRYFLTIVQEENILRAAEVLHITQPSLSRQIAQLEEELGTKLFIRGNRKITLTEAGVLLKRRAEDILSLVEKTEQEFTDFNGGDVSGIIAIGAGEIGSVSELAEMLALFSEKYPKITYSMHSGAADAIKERLDKGLIDFALLMEPVDYDKYDYYHMATVEHMVALMRADDPLSQKKYITAEDLRDKKLLLPNRSVIQTQLSNWFGPVFKKENVFSSKNLMNNAALMVEQGLGIAIGAECVPSMYDPKRFCYRRLFPEIETRSVLVWKKQLPFGTAASMFLNFLRMTYEHTKV